MKASTERGPGIEALLERDKELNVLAAAVSGATDGAGGLVLVEGPAGIGKSSLLASAADLARARDLVVCTARGSSMEQDFSFGIAVQLFSRVLEAAPNDDREAFLSGAAQLAAPLLDPPQPERDAGPAGEASTFGLLHGLHWLTANLAERRPLLLAVDDGQWSDEQSLRFVHYLAQRIEYLPVTVVLTVRTGEPGSDAGALAALRVHPGAAILKPQPLSGAASAELVRRRLPDAEDAFCRACEQVTAGNPFYLGELLEAARSGGVSPTEDGATRLTALGPIRISRSILARLGRLPEACRSLAVAVAVGGDEMPFERAAALAGLDPSAAREAADTLASADILAPGEPLVFVHPVVREVIYADTPNGRRAAIHRDAARLLVEEGRSAEQVAAQLLESASGSDEWARTALHEAALRAKARGAPEVAARYLRRALEEAPAVDERGELLALAGLAEAEAGLGTGTETLAEAVSMIQSSRRRAQALFDLAFVLSHGGRYPHAARTAERGRSELGGDDPGLAAKLDALWAMSSTWLDLTDPEETARHIEASLAAPDLGGSPAGRAVIGNASVARGFTGANAETLQALAGRVLDHRRPVDDPFDLSAFTLASFAALLAGDIEGAERAGDAALEMARRRGSMLELAAALHVRSMARFQAGRIVEALADAEAAVEAGQWGSGATLPMAHGQLVFALLERGDVDGAAAALELPGGEERWAVNVSYGVFLVARAAVWIAQGRPDEALDQLLLAGRLAEGVNARHSAICPWRPAAVAILLANEEIGEARRLAAEDLDRAEEFGAPGPIGAALRARGLATNGAQGLAFLRRSERVLADSPARLEHAHTLVELGSALRRARRRKMARDPLRRGLDLALRGGATVLAERAEVELRASGARPRSLVLTGTESLTPSERRVADLASQGLTNREVAQRLYVTKRTVEAHLSHAYRKLEISSRDELAAALDDRSA